MAKSKVIDKDLGWNDLVKRLEEIKEARVKVGVLDDGKRSEERLTVAQIAAIHEYGTEDGRIPARPFVKPTFDKQRDKLVKMAKNLMGQVIDGKISVKQGLNLLGSQLAADIKATVVAGVPPPNALSTIIRKARKSKKFTAVAENIGQAFGQAGILASVKPLIDTGRMLGAITWVVVMKGEKDE